MGQASSRIGRDGAEAQRTGLTDPFPITEIAFVDPAPGDVTLDEIAVDGFVFGDLLINDFALDEPAGNGSELDEIVDGDFTFDGLAAYDSLSVVTDDVETFGDSFEPTEGFEVASLGRTMSDGRPEARARNDPGGHPDGEAFAHQTPSPSWAVDNAHADEGDPHAVAPGDGGGHSEEPTPLWLLGGEGAPPSAGSPTSFFSTMIYGAQPSGLNSIDSLAYGQKWGDALGTGVDLTYSFGTTDSVYIDAYPGNAPTQGFAEFTDAQKAAARDALDTWSAVANVTFTEVTDSATVAGDIRFGVTDVAAPTAYAYTPLEHPVGGDIWISDSAFYADMSSGTYGYMTLLHEIGHAIGLAHPHDTGGGSAVADLATDSTSYTVMSYRSYEGAPLTGYTQDYYPTTAMISDIAAVQYIYGANTGHNDGDTTYGWDSGSAVLETIWDGGGIDTIDLSNQLSDAVINLTAGQWSEVGPAYDSGLGFNEYTLMIAENVVIENVIGGSGDDVLIGNSWSNVITGGAGNDALSGGAGDDTFVFTAGFGDDTLNDFAVGFDKIDVSALNVGTFADLLGSTVDIGGQVAIALAQGTITLTGVTAAQLVEDDFIGLGTGTAPVATAGDDVLSGSAGADTIDGLAGNDALSGLGGDDVLIGGAGDHARRRRGRRRRGRAWAAAPAPIPSTASQATTLCRASVAMMC